MWLALLSIMTSNADGLLTAHTPRLHCDTEVLHHGDGR
jgi:hypothetical protein